MKLSIIGQIAKQCWENIPDYFNNIQLDEFVIMPNHIHGIIHIVDDNNDGGWVHGRDFINGRGLINQTLTVDPDTPTFGPDNPTINKIPTIEFPTKNKKSSNDTNWILMKKSNITLGKIIRFYKTKTTRLIRQNRYKNFAWQRNYYDHIICNQIELNHIHQYTINNPLRWELDKKFNEIGYPI
jgi:REP element-mobilizing transposase RayT